MTSPRIEQSRTPSPVISAAELQAALAEGRHVVLLDVRRDGTGARRDEYEAGHLPGAHFVDLSAQLAGPRYEGSGNNPLPSEQAIQAEVERWGINATSLVVVYPDKQPAGASRAWWVLRWAGLPDVRYLDGGLNAWIATGGELSTDEAAEGGGTATVTVGSLPTIDADGAADLAGQAESLLLDARPSDNYAGIEGDGHIPGALSLPSGETIGRDGLLKGDDELRALFDRSGALDGQPIGVYCGSGVGATLDLLVLTKLGVPASLYPGSFSAWSSDPSRPIATGIKPAEAPPHRKEPEMPYAVGDSVSVFTLPRAEGGELTVDPAAAPATVVVFTSNHCPYALAWHDRLQALATDYAGKGVVTVQINSNDETVKPADSTAASAERVDTGAFAGPYLRDASNDLAAAWGAQRTPDAYVLDGTGTVVYHGAPDANYEDESQNASYLRDALDDVLAGQAVRLPETPAVGCTIKWSPARQRTVTIGASSGA